MKSKKLKVIDNEGDNYVYHWSITEGRNDQQTLKITWDKM